MSRSVLKLAAFAIAALLWNPPARGHVALDAPNGGEQYEVGTTIGVVWHVEVQHGLLNWDLEYSTTGTEGPWFPVATDLPPGDPTDGAVHVYEWVVPDAVSDQVRMRVRQDNDGTDYYGQSDNDLSFVPLQSASRLRVLRMDTPFPDLAMVFRGLPCARMSDLRICAEAPGVLESLNDPVLPLDVAGDGDLVMIELDLDLSSVGPPVEIRLDQGPGGALIVHYP